MKLSAIIIDYRSRMNISQREFARRCGVSNSYISFIENECNPKSGKAPVPTIQQYKNIATAMDMTLQELFEILDDAPVDISFPVSSGSLSDEESHLISLWRGADPDARRFAMEMLQNHQKKDTPSKAGSPI